MKELTEELFVERANATHNNKYNYNNVVYINATTYELFRNKLSEY